MICYLDTTFCASDVKNHTCGRELTKKERKKAEELAIPIAWGYFCEQKKAND